MAQKWEYKFIMRWRAVEQASLSQYKPGDWVYLEDGREIGKIDLISKSRELGEQGWELVSILPQASGSVWGNGSAPGVSYAGLTTEVVWVFKRPK